MTLRTLILALLLAAPGGARADAAACAALHGQTPQAVAGFSLLERVDYGSALSGYGVQYESRDGARLSMFHYLGGTTIPRAEELPARMRAEMGNIVRYYATRGLTTTQAFRIELGNGQNPLGAEQGFREVPGVRDVTLLGVVEGCLVKLRYTGPALNDRRLLRLWEAASGR